MSFWKLTKALAAAPTDGINGILAPLKALDDPADAPSPSSPSSPSAREDAPLSPEDTAAHHRALDALLAEPDLLSEIKSGGNARLTDFLARKEVVLRLGGWVVWGLGRGFLDLSEGAEEAGGKTQGKKLGSGVLPDEMEQGKVPDEVLEAAERERKSMGGVPRRRDVDEKGKFVEGDADDETDQERKWANFPRLCTEILVSSAPSLTDTLFRHESASTKPHTCPSPDTFLLPFWESILGSTELQLASRAQQVGYWARVNSALLDGPMGQEVLAQILTIPHLPPRLLALLPFCSPINDLLLLLLRVSRPPSPLVPSTVTQTIRMLDPFSALGKPGHAAAEELLRGVIEICLAVPRAQGGPPGGPGGPGGPFGAGMGAPQAGEEPVFEWRDTTLARKIADEKSVRTLLDWMLAGLEDGESALEEAQPAVTERAGEATDDDAATPVPPSSATLNGEAAPTPAAADTNGDEVDEAARERELRTSSLVSSLAVLIELIRKNNSDFVEQQMLSWARRKQAAEAERELLEAEGAELVRGLRDEEEERGDDKGPSVVDLGTMLSLVARRIGDFQRLIKKPRSSTAPVPTAGGKLAPLTLERFRICEFFAELLHCSNMSLLNRSDRSGTLYDANGHLARGFDAADELAAALAGPGTPAGEDDLDLPRGLQSPDLPPVHSDFSTSPNDHALGAYSGMSTPSGRESLDEESGGVLTKAEARELKEIVAAAGQMEEDEEERRNGGDAPDADADEAKTPTMATGDAAKRHSHTSNGSSLREERDLPPTPSVYSVASRQLPAVPLPPGPLLKSKFLEHGVIPSMLALFFEFPWNNFLHNVVFDVIQQIFHGRLDRTLDRQLAESVFVDGKLCERILDGQKANDEAAAARTNMRLGYMGHLSLIAEETVKLFDRFPELYQAVEASVPQPAWNDFVSTTLREARERDLTPLSGGRASLNLSVNKAPSSSSLSDEDDEFPMNSARAMRAMEAAGMAGGGNAVDEGAFGKPAAAEAGGLSDQFSRYLADALTSDRAVGSSDEDDEDDNWLGGSRFDPGDVDFELDTESRAPRTFGFDDRFDAAGPSAFGSRAGGSDDEGDWAPFEGTATAKAGDAFGSDDFTPTIASSSAASNGGGFTSSFPTTFGSEFAAPSTSAAPQHGGDEDDFGDFEAAEAGAFPSGASITLPAMDAFDDFDFGEESRAGGPASQSFGGAVHRPSFSRTSTEEEDGSDRFGRLSLSELSDPGTPDDGGARPLPSVDVVHANAVAGLGSNPADMATSPTEPLGPAVHPGAHLTDDGMVEAEVEGRTVRAPADDIILAHRRNSFDGAQQRRSSSEERRPGSTSEHGGAADS
ncbi:sporulation-induced protein [Rhodotorula kratochvilovae]